jgi:hypothetical protein
MSSACTPTPVVSPTRTARRMRMSSASRTARVASTDRQSSAARAERNTLGAARKCSARMTSPSMRSGSSAGSLAGSWRRRAIQRRAFCQPSVQRIPTMTYASHGNAATSPHAAPTATTVRIARAVRSLIPSDSPAGSASSELAAVSSSGALIRTSR